MKFSVIAWILGPIIAALAVLRIFFVDLAIVGHNGMAPTLIAGDQVAVWRDAQIERGDVVMCGNPKRPGEYVVGRVLAKIGDRITYERNQIRINNMRRDLEFEAKLSFVDTVAKVTYDVVPVTESVGEAKYETFYPVDNEVRLPQITIQRGFFLLGDNRTRRHVDDSRWFGEVDPLTCKGKEFMRIKPSETSPAELKHGWIDWISGG